MKRLMICAVIMLFVSQCAIVKASINNNQEEEENSYFQAGAAVGAALVAGYVVYNQGYNSGMYDKKIEFSESCQYSKSHKKYACYVDEL